MIVLDTNVVSEAMMRSAPHPSVHSWLNEQAAQTLFLTSVTAAELLFGVAALPAGKRKSSLAAAVDALLGLFGDRILPFDVLAAQHYASLAVRARKSGRGLPTPGGYIAAIAASRGYAVASRDTAPFVAAGLDVINPWEAPR